MSQNELVKENQEQRRTIKRQEAEIARAHGVIRAADAMHEASQGIPQSGSAANRELAEKGRLYQAAKDAAKGEQER